MGSPANFELIEETGTHLLIRDVGPWSAHFTVTNDAEGVCRRLAPRLNGRRLFYFDSLGELGELICTLDGKFVRFAPAAEVPL